ncbi:MAG: S1-like domain-containing RNA-binding protein [Bacteroidales bacterium]|nr:S1-like domain-containing RNA-binding protein [Bacteroidales bacterium]
MINIGRYNTLKVARRVDFGLYLDAGDGLEILLPQRYVPDGVKIGDELTVFIYNDSDDRLIATTETPFATVGEFAFLQVRDVNATGAFLDWGLPKDLLVPFSQQRARMNRGGIYLVYVYFDDSTKRIAASAKIDKFLGNVIPRYRDGDKVSCLVIDHTDIGYKVIVDNLHRGMIYENQVYRPLELEQTIEAFVRAVRTDGKIDLILSDKTGRRVSDLSEHILQAIDDEGGQLFITDNSTPDEIKAAFACSKKDYKKALGYLYKKGLIMLSREKITRAENRGDDICQGHSLND